ncbi:glycoside hydrolase family 95 protein [Chryseolinea soli]|uniref:Glycoside hydrolase family 95 protein n=2 Tax=Chryseolinea soli TaxID=2321403 RepID=A0A385T334_9BACT|nr:glycoside hydrolase family 95 protein [Chryseolinea soli]
MRILFCFVAVFAVLSISRTTIAQNVQENTREENRADLSLWYTKPATKWVEALPLGNGRIGAMMFGIPDKELIQLNETTLWSGGPIKSDINPNAPGLLPLVRKALANGQTSKADSLVRLTQGNYTESFLPMGDISIEQDFSKGDMHDYYRGLDIATATQTTRFKVKGVAFTRESFISAPDNVMVLRFTASQAGALNMRLSASSLLQSSIAVSGHELIVAGKAPAHVDPSYLHEPREPIVYEDDSKCSGMRFQFRIRVLAGDGQVIDDKSALVIRNATNITVYVTAATSFNGFDVCPDSGGKDENKLASDAMAAAVKMPFNALRARHVADYSKYFSRVRLQIDQDGENANANLPSDLRLKAYSTGSSDHGLEALYFQYGRYLLISSSRPEGRPANLQGLWNKELRAPWSSNYTININTQMNYWPAEITNLSEMHEPLLRFIMRDLSVTGARTAKEFYGLGGWVANHNTDIWATSNPVGERKGGPQWANWPMGGAWLCRHLWEHFNFTQDLAFLKEAYPVMKESARFASQWLVLNADGYWVTSPSVSPENQYIDDKGKRQVVAVGSTMDMSITWDVFTMVIAAGKILEDKDIFVSELAAKRGKLLPLQIGKRGNLQEWSKDWEDGDLTHRHASHLYGLYPGIQISPMQSIPFASAAQRSLEIRTDVGTGWSLGWKINFWARLLDGNHSHKLLRRLLHYTEDSGTNMVDGGGTYPNFFDAHPPFQIDGNFAGTAGITEMLLQSQLNEIFLLPALPDEWGKGRVSGLRARGNFEIAIEWDQNTLTNGEVRSLIGGPCTIRTKVPIKVQGLKSTSKHEGDYYITTFKTQKGKTYTFSGQRTKS